MEFPSKWGATGRGVPDIIGSITAMPNENGDFEKRKLLGRLIGMLYGLVSGAQRNPESKDETKHAVQQLVLANSALIAVEAEAFLALIASGLEGPAEIHLRTMAELTTRIILCREHHELALSLYRSWVASWEDIVEKTLRFPLVKPTPESKKREKNMRQLEDSPPFRSAREEIIGKMNLPDKDELTMYSKRVHGDIYALVQVSKNLSNRGPDIRSAIAKELPHGVTVNIRLSRAIGIMLAANAHIEDEFKFETNAKTALKECFDLFESIQEQEGREVTP